MTDDGAVIGNPTYMGDIRHFFRESPDILSMKQYGIDLATYDGVRDNALRIFFRVREGSMPCDGAWPTSRVETFYNWMKNGYPRGQASPVPASQLLKGAPATRIRRNLKDLQPAEIEKVKTAFRGMMARHPDDPQSYFAIAGLHWLPGNPPLYYCRHHENAYNPWHRVYLMRFEDAMRSVDGCSDVTLPYWDIADPDIPDVLWDSPFDSYEVPVTLKALNGDTYPPAGTPGKYRTERYDKSAIETHLTDPNVDVPGNIVSALGSSHWEDFNGWTSTRTQTGIIRAHDNGHNSSGPTMQNQDVAAFDPIFWFFHCNWDRIWWKWQTHYRATTLSTFKNTLAPGYPADWLDDPVLNPLPPFGYTTAETIDLSAFDTDYEHPAAEAAPELRAATHGSLFASRSFAVAPVRQVSVRVKELNRLEIPGSFNVYLRVGDKVIGKQGLFQPSTPKKCATCVKNALADFDFLVDPADLASGEVNIEIRLLKNGAEIPFPVARAGNPTVNARLLLANDSD
jgi:hypothetical protein